jgi:hypothetical protein
MVWDGLSHGWDPQHDCNPSTQPSPRLASLAARFARRAFTSANTAHARSLTVSHQVDEAHAGKNLLGLKHLSVDIADVKKKVCVEVRNGLTLRYSNPNPN